MSNDRLNVVLLFDQFAKDAFGSVDLVREMVASGELPHIPKGGGKERTHFVIDRVDPDKWIEKKKQKVA